MQQQVKDKFLELFTVKPLIVHSPGRINMIGEHTDYNNGFVMPASIDKGIVVALAPSESGKSQVFSLKYNQMIEIDVENPEKASDPAWANYLLGVLAQIKNKGGKPGNFNCVFHGDLLTGAGLSSSAAVECAFGFGLNELFELNFSKLDIIQIAQWAEHNYVGVKCGIMDQFTSVMGKKDHVMLLDCESLEYEYFPLELGDYTLVLCDTNVKHSLASSEYNTRRLECEEGLGIIQLYNSAIKSFRDADAEVVKACKDKMSEKVYNRCLYVVEEIERTTSGAIDLKNGNLKAFGQKMFATHDGLSKLYEVSCPELDYLAEQARYFDGIIGARMMGGGFGGCTLNIIKKDKVDEFIATTGEAYEKCFYKAMTSYVVTTGNGASVLESPNQVLKA